MPSCPPGRIKLANWLRAQGVRRGDRVLLMLPNVPPLWETMLAAMKLGAVVIPATTLLVGDELRDRLDRGGARFVIAMADQCAKFDGMEKGLGLIAIGGAPAGWTAYEGFTEASADFTPDGDPWSEDPLLLYFTSGTTAKPKLVLHTHRSYPVGHLSTMYWVGLQPGDVHWNISSPGWAKHAWSNVFAPLNAEATVFVYNYTRFNARPVLDVLVRCGVTTLCAPPTVWRMLIQEDLKASPVKIRELVGAGEPLNPEVIDQVKAAWGLTIRDGFGQTETTAQVGNSPRPAGKSRQHGTSASRLRRRPDRRRRQRDGGGRNRPQARPAPRRADGRLPGLRQRAGSAAGRRLLPHR